MIPHLIEAVCWRGFLLYLAVPSLVVFIFWLRYGGYAAGVAIVLGTLAFLILLAVLYSWSTSPELRGVSRPGDVEARALRSVVFRHMAAMLSAVVLATPVARLMFLALPRWLQPSWRTRLAALPELTSLKLLAWIARSDEEVAVQREAARLAVQRLLDEQAQCSAREFAKRTEKMGVSTIQDAAAPVIAEMLFRQESEQSAWESAQAHRHLVVPVAERLTEQHLIGDAAAKYVGSQLPVAFIRKVTDPAVLVEITQAFEGSVTERHHGICRVRGEIVELLGEMMAHGDPYQALKAAVDRVDAEIAAEAARVQEEERRKKEAARQRELDRLSACPVCRGHRYITEYEAFRDPSPWGGPPREVRTGRSRTYKCPACGGTGRR